MTKWKNITGKFSPEQLEVIKAFQKILGVNENQFVRISVIAMIFGIGSLMKLAVSDETQKIDKKYQKLRKEVSKHPDLKNIKLAVQDMTKTWEQAINHIFKENEPDIKKFTKKRKLGRPKSKKKKRGRPKDTGI